MSVRAELSKKNEYYIPKHRYYELRHFCRQYVNWKLVYKSYTSGRSKSYIQEGRQLSIFDDPVADAASIRERAKRNVEIIEQSAHKTDPVIGEFVLLAAVEGLSYEQVNARITVPCGKNLFYQYYRKFFWILDKERG